MIRIGSDAYEALLGNIGKEALSHALALVSALVVCATVGVLALVVVFDFEWEVI